MQLRTARPVEARAIADVLVAAFEEFKTEFTPAAYIATILNDEIIADRIARSEMLVALVEDAVVGTVTMEAHGNALLVRSMAVAPAARGAGLARGLLHEVEKRALESNSVRLELTTTPFMLAATRLYESFGFRKTQEPPRDLHGTRLIPMAKGL